MLVFYILKIASIIRNRSFLQIYLQVDESSQQQNAQRKQIFCKCLFHLGNKTRSHYHHTQIEAVNII